MRVKHSLTLALLLTSPSVFSGEEPLVQTLILEPELYVNGNYAEPNMAGIPVAKIAHGQPAVLEFQFVDQAEGTYFTEFQPMHEKIAHLVLVRDDFTSFSHVHPYYDQSTGVFQITLGREQSHPDNADAGSALGQPGTYAMFIEVKAAGKIRKHEFRLKIGDEWERSSIVADPTEGKTTVAYFDSDLKKSKSKSRFRVELDYSSVEQEIPGHRLYFFNVRLLDNIGGKGYQPIANLEPWLMMGAHAIITTTNDEYPGQTLFAHKHHMEMPGESGELQFDLFSKNRFVRTGIYKIWVQVKQEGRILTFPIAFHIDAERSL